MRPLLVLSHRLHCRNWLTSGLLDRMTQAGLRGTVAAPAALLAAVDDQVPTGWSVIPLEPWWSTRPQAAVREALRLGFLAAGARQGGKTYQAKLRAKRRPVAALEMAIWRLVAAVRDPVPLLRAIEQAIPAPRTPFPKGCTHLILPTMIHEDVAQAGIVKVARRAKVPVLAVPASWDTLTTKGAFLDQPDAIAVWGEVSAWHALGHHGFKAAAVVGPPHFWPYAPTARISKIVFQMNQHVLFAGTTVNYAADEEAVAHRLAEALQATPATRDIVLLYRPHPRGRRIGHAPGLINDPAWKPGWSLERSEIPRVKSLVEGAIATVSAFSTVVLESALCNTGALMIGFGQSVHGGRAIDHAQHEHMEALIDKPGVWVVDRMVDLVIRLKDLKGPQRPSMREWALTIAAVGRDPRETMVDWLKEQT